MPKCFLTATRFSPLTDVVAPNRFICRYPPVYSPIWLLLCRCSSTCGLGPAAHLCSQPVWWAVCWVWHLGSRENLLAAAFEAVEASTSLCFHFRHTCNVHLCLLDTLGCNSASGILGFPLGFDDFIRGGVALKGSTAVISASRMETHTET